jgi:hypothetical protein
MKKIKIILVILCLSAVSNAEEKLPIEETLITNALTYSKTKQVWEKVYDDLTKHQKAVRGLTYIAPLRGNGYTDRLHKNGRRDTIVFIPQDTDLSKPVDFIFYFHGLGGFKERDFKTRILRHTKSIPSSANYIIIIPEMPWSKNTSTPRTRQTLVFQKKKEFPTFVAAVTKIAVSLAAPTIAERVRCFVHNICALPIAKAILLGHSAGGGTLMSISRSGNLDWFYNKRRAKEVKIIFSDAAYGQWLAMTWTYFKAKEVSVYGWAWQTEFILLTRKGDKPHRHTLRFLKRLNKIPKNITHIEFERHLMTHNDIGNTSFKWVYGP